MEHSDNFLKSARESFVKDAVYMRSREQFEDYMRVLENQFYETAMLPRSPYVDVKKQEGYSLPSYPPQAFGPNEADAVRGKSHRILL